LCSFFVGVWKRGVLRGQNVTADGWICQNPELESVTGWNVIEGADLVLDAIYSYS
jgi:hypothetical protein